MLKISRWVFAAIGVTLVFAAILIVFIRDAQTPPAPMALPLTKSFNESPTGFTLLYPEEWQYFIPARGLMVMGPPQTIFQGEPGPTLTVQRADPLTVVGTLDAALDRYLSLGPLSNEAQWEVVEPIRVTTFEGRDARAVDLQGANAEGAPELYTRVIATVADNTFVYLIVLSTPAERRDAFDPTLNAMLETIRILE